MATGNKLIQLPTINFSDKNFQQLQDNTNKALVQLQQSPFQGGNLLTEVAIGTTPTAINHGLGRSPQVWTIVDQDTNTTVKRITWTDTSITLQAGSACTISIWVN